MSFKWYVYNIQFRHFMFSPCANIPIHTFYRLCLVVCYTRFITRFVIRYLWSSHWVLLYFCENYLESFPSARSDKITCYPRGTKLYAFLSSTLPDIDPDTAYVICISVSLGFRQKPSDTALLSVIALTTFNCIVNASVTKGALVCFVMTVHWWRHRTHCDVTEAYRALRNI